MKSSPKRPRCVSCSAKMIRWGKTRKGTNRYYCPVCKKTKRYRMVTNTHRKIYTLFKHYVLWGVTYEMLSATSGYSVRTLTRYFHRFINTIPPKLALVSQSHLDEAYLLIDGLWFGKWFVLMVYRQHRDLTILHISVAGKEVATKISRDLHSLLSLAYRFTGVVSDGGTGIVAAIEHVFPHTPHQICLAHMHRDVINALGRYPKDPRVKELKYLADWVWMIESYEALRFWKQQVKNWITKNYSFLMEYRTDTTGRWWYVHKGIRKAVRILLRLPRTSFTFLSHPTMPKTTNELEATFGHLGKRWLAHRGLKKERWENFMQWFVYFYNQEKLSQSKKKHT